MKTFHPSTRARTPSGRIQRRLAAASALAGYKACRRAAPAVAAPLTAPCLAKFSGQPGAFSKSPLKKIGALSANSPKASEIFWEGPRGATYPRRFQSSFASKMPGPKKAAVRAPKGRSPLRARQSSTALKTQSSARCARCRVSCFSAGNRFCKMRAPSKTPNGSRL